MTDEIERLKQQHKAELDLAQEVIINLRRDLAHAHKRIESQDAVWNDATELAAQTAEGNYSHIGVQTKHDKCPHGKYSWEDCDLCAAAAIRSNKRPLA